MNDPTLDLTELRRLAEEAKTGESWYAQPNDLIGGWCVMPVNETPATSGVNEIADFTNAAIARYIAAVNPATLLALLDRLEGKL